MSERDWKSEERKLREERIKEINKFFGQIRKKQEVLIFTTPNTQVSGGLYPDSLFQSLGELIKIGMIVTSFGEYYLYDRWNHFVRRYLQ